MTANGADDHSNPAQRSIALLGDLLEAYESPCRRSMIACIGHQSESSSKAALASEILCSGRPTSATRAVCSMRSDQWPGIVPPAAARLVAAMQHQDALAMDRDLGAEGTVRVRATGIENLPRTAAGRG